ncbi:pts system IIb component protein [Spiroplasma sp. ChiS]|uniref:pts system IIb component protein n=1 Tax=Spiroplasma sp. ChiS TaxID=2099885 RepID=UPI000CF9A518|nr:pts system IIb component protein [Spiroplasma sp. ChiS]PQP78236.1 pts system IIb component protein [Spiroplasma sp. ChiS]
MIKIALICSAKLSIYQQKYKINDVIVKNNYDMQFFVITPEQLENNYNIILLAPQVEYLSAKVAAIAINSKVAVLPSELYINNDSKGIIDFVNTL